MTWLSRYRLCLSLFIAGLILSGLTAFPILTLVDLLVAALDLKTQQNEVAAWIVAVQIGLLETYLRYPWIAYGTDWLAFGHLVIALFFFGPMIDPVRNRWVLTVGMIACAGVIPLALICGTIRGIPWFWQLIDCSFGILGIIPLAYCRRISLGREQTPSTRRALA